MVTGNKSTTGRIRSSRTHRAHSFYAKALSQAESAVLQEAMQVSGLDQEIALMRLRLLQALEEHPEDIELMLRGAALLSRMVATKYGLTRTDEADMLAAIDRAVESLRELRVEASDG